MVLLIPFWTLFHVHASRHRVVEYYQLRACYTLQLLAKLDLISRTSELARLFGIQFYDVLSRGSQVSWKHVVDLPMSSFRLSVTVPLPSFSVQFRVESMMLRLAKPANYVAVSPGVRQRAQ